jgi:hypothetical protein
MRYSIESNSSGMAQTDGIWSNGPNADHEQSPIACVLLLFILSISGPGLCQQGPTADAMERWRDSTVSLGTPMDLSIVKDPRMLAGLKAEGLDSSRPFFFPNATGVLFVSEDRSIWLVTAKHVFDEPAKRWKPKSLNLRFSWFSTMSLQDNLGVPIELEENGKRLWIPHPNTSVDLATIQLKIPVGAAGRAIVNAVGLGAVPPSEEIYDGESVFVLGYPGIAGLGHLNKALLRAGIIAWVDPKDAVNSPILVDTMLFPGNSGGPVFSGPVGMGKNNGLKLGGPSYFLGIVSKGCSDQVPIQMVPSGPVSTQCPGIGIIEPAARVAELLLSSA